MSKRTKIETIEIEGRAGLVAVAESYAITDLRKTALEAGLNSELAEIREQYETRLQEARNTYAPELHALTSHMEMLGASLLVWANNNKHAFTKVKSMDIVHAIIGFRIGQPALKMLSKWTWAKVLVAVKARFIADLYVRTREEVDREAILQDRVKLKDDLSALGLKVHQKEDFFVEVKKETEEE